MELTVLGFSGHSYVCISIAQQLGWSIKGYLNPTEVNDTPLPNIQYLGSENDENCVNELKGENTIIGIGDNIIRQKLFDRLNGTLKFPVLIHPSSIVDPSVKIESGTLVFAGAILNTFANVGKCAIINTGAIIEHECEINDFTHIAPGALLCGNVKVGKRTFVGAGSVIKQGITIGDDVTIGAGSVIIKDIPSGSKVVGNPGRFI